MSLFRTVTSSFSRHFQNNRIASCLQRDLTNWRNIHSRIPPLCFQNTSVLYAEPLKKKRRVDPTVLRERADKKIRRLQRDIRKLEKVAKQFKPIAELQIPKKAVRDSERQRPMPIIDEKEFLDRAALKQEWMIFKRKEHLAELSAIQRIIAAQERAMDALEEASPDLYEQALEARFGDTEVDCGEMIPLSDILSAPTISFKADPDKYYSLFMIGPRLQLVKLTDIDQNLHWYVYNIRGNNVAQGVASTPYIPPIPVDNLEPDSHAYVLLVYAQVGKYQPGEVQQQPFLYFDFTKYKKEQNLTDPADAGNFFRVFLLNLVKIPNLV